MTGTVSPSLPTIGNPNSTEDANTRSSLITLRDALNAVLTSANILDGAQLSAATVGAAALANNSVTTAKILDANVTDAKLASPNNAVYQTLLHASGTASGAVAATTYFISSANAGFLPNSSSTNSAPFPIFDFASGDYTVAALTTRFRLKMEVVVGSTSPSTVVITAGLYPVTISGGNITLGTVVTGSTAASSGLATNTISRFNSGDFAASALLANPGIYTFGYAITSITVPVGITVATQLQTRHT